MNDSIVLVCAVLGSMASGVLVAYGVCLSMFGLFRMHARQVAVRSASPRSPGHPGNRRLNPIGDNGNVTSLAAGPAPSLNLTLAVTGASGSIFAAEMLRALDRDPRVAHINFIPSENSLRVFAEELHLGGRNDLAEKLLGAPSAKLQQHTESDIGANVASGSYPCSGMIVLPCSMGTLAGIANGMASNLIERAADVTLKERRPLILCVRETPFNRIHLRNMTLAAEAGATVFPVMPTLYNLPQDTTAMARQFVDHVLAHIGLPQPGAYEWRAD